RRPRAQAFPCTPLFRAVDEGVEAQLARISQRPPDPLAGAGPQRQAVAVVDLRAPVPGHAAVVLADLEHAGAGGDAQPLDLPARVDRKSTRLNSSHVKIS